MNILWEEWEKILYLNGSSLFLNGMKVSLLPYQILLSPVFFFFLFSLPLEKKKFTFYCGEFQVYMLKWNSRINPLGLSQVFN